jgi:hypothetical protein
MIKFSTPFPELVYDGCKIICTVDGFTYQARLAHDVCCFLDDDDSHNPDQSVTGCDDEQQKRLLAARDAFTRGEWFYCGIIVSARHNATGGLWDHLASLWGIEANYPGTDNSYLTEVANELLATADVELRAKIKELTAVAQ